MKLKKLVSASFTLFGAFSMLLASCSGGETSSSAEPSSSTSSSSDSSEDSVWTSSTEPEGEYSLELEEGCKQLTIYYYRSSGYDNCDIWMWHDEADMGGQLFHECDYGAKVVVNVPDTISLVGFIIRTNCSDPGGKEWGTATKDATEDDRYVTLTGDYTEIYTKAGDANSYTSEDGGVTLDLILTISMADMRSLTTIMYTFSSAYKITSVSDVQVIDNEGLSADIQSVSTVGTSATVGFVYLTNELDITKSYTLYVGNVSATVIPKTYYSSSEFEEAYSYDGNLGVEITDSETIFRLWAPSASAVNVNFFSAGNGGSATSIEPLVRGEKGVWEYTASGNLSGTYYTYSVTTGNGTQEAVDPYAVSAGVNGQRGMILDLDTTDPEGWSNEVFVNDDFENYTDAEIWEVQVRDFSVGITSSKYPGKFLAFTEEGLTQDGHAVGLDYLKELGITHVHLMPSYDYASVDETLTGDDAEYNWGYDPQNYNVPEGSYSTDPYNGEVRVTEFKQMVQALHNAGISVVMDVVYNHTYDSNSNLNKCVPYYYYRYTTTGTLSNGSGCGNETASERSMYSKYMLDSVTYWQSEYNLDGFRFDLMGLHDIETMQSIENAVHAVNPKAIIYGEGWTGGTSTLSSSKQSILANIQDVNSENPTNGIAMFSDVMRDAIKGSVFDMDDVGFATGANRTDRTSIVFSMRGSVYAGDTYTNSNGWFANNPTQVINYASAHDNNTLWDRICYVYGEESDTLQDRLKRNALSAAIVQTSLGIPFMMAGEELLRSKKDADGEYVADSYNAGDAVNMIDWNYSDESASMMEFYKGLIAFRKSSPTLRSATNDDGTNVVCSVDDQTGGTTIAMQMTSLDQSETLFIVYNAAESATTVTLPDGNWDLYINGMTAGTTALESSLSGDQTIPSISCNVYRKS